MSYPLLNYGTNDPLNFHLDDVNCIGNESKLSECGHRGIGIHDCRAGSDETGVLCTGKHFQTLKTASIITDGLYIHCQALFANMGVFS